MNETIKKVQEKADEIGHSIDDGVEHTAKKHNMPKWRVWLWYGIAAMAVIGAAKIMGWI